MPGSDEVTPENLRKQADKEDAAALEAIDKGDQAAAKTHIIRAQAFRLVASQMEFELPVSNRRGKQKKVTATERVRRSKGKTESDDALDPLIIKVNEAGYSLRALVEKLKAEGWRVSHPFLYQCRRGLSRIRKPLADRIEALTGFRATRPNWPADGWAREPK